jgi:hypothetical protein
MNPDQWTTRGSRSGTSALLFLATLLIVTGARAGQLSVAYCTQFNKTTSCGSCGSASTGMGLAYVGKTDNPCDIQHWIYNGVSCGPGEGELVDRANAYCASHGLPSPCTTHFNWAGDPWGRLVAEIDAGRPFVAHVYQYGYHHYVLVSGYSGSSVYISDSATSHLGWRSWGEFAGQWAQKNYDGIRFLIDRCQPKTCADVGAECGEVDNGCGGTADCGACGGQGSCNAKHRCNWYPKGHVDEASCGQIAGWAQDRDSPGQSLTIRIALDGAGASHAQLQLQADESRADLCSALGSCKHGFRAQVPMSFRDYATHSVHVYALDSTNSQPIEIDGSPTTFACHPPKGHLDSANCDGFRGWADDADTPADAIEVHIALDGVGYEDAQIVVTSNKPRADLCSALGSCNHGFVVPMPVFMRNSAAHRAQLFAKDTQGGAPVEVSGSPQSFRCDPPVIALSPSKGVLRPVASMAVFEAWRFSMLWDVAQYPDKALADYSTDENIPDEPRLIVADDDSSRVWLLDQQVRRQVPSQSAMAAWRFDSSLIETLNAAQVRKWRKGADLRVSPFLLKASGSSIYVLDSWFGYESRGGEDAVLRESQDTDPEPLLRTSGASVDDPVEGQGCTCRLSTSYPPDSPHWGLALGGVCLFLISRRRPRCSAERDGCEHSRSATRRNAP